MLMMLGRTLVLLLIAFSPAALAQETQTGPDLVLELDAAGSPPKASPELELASWEPGERIVWNITTQRQFLTLEIRATGFDIERPRQLVPSIVEPDAPYPLFEPVGYADLWTSHKGDRIAHVTQEGPVSVIRLGIPGPANGTLTLTRDITPPTLSIGERNLSNHFSFYQETRTDEPALVDLQIRPAGRDEWNQNPTPIYHYYQRFPVQGLDPETDYETRFIATDWAGNEAIIPGAPHRTPSAPVRAVLVVVPVFPAPNSTIQETDDAIVAEFPNGTILQDGSGIRFFLDKQELKENLRVEANRVSYMPSKPLTIGPHSVSVEVTSEDGAHGVARWIFYVGRADAPAPSLLIGLACLAIVALFWPRP